MNTHQFSSPFTSKMKKRYKREVMQTKMHHQRMQKVLQEYLTADTKILGIETSIEFFAAEPGFSQLDPMQQKLMNLSLTGTEHTLVGYSNAFRYQLGFAIDDPRFEIWKASSGQEAPLLSPKAYDAIILTGSKKMVTDMLENESDPDGQWMRRIIQFLDVWDFQKPSLIVCFAHQLEAYRRGGVVEWMREADKVTGEAGVVTIDINSEGKNHPFLQGFDDSVDILAIHRQQVTKPSQDANVLASNSSSIYQIFSYGENVLSIQNHPEHTNASIDVMFSLANLKTAAIEKNILEKDTNKPREVIFSNFIKVIGKRKQPGLFANQ